jgi:hypothetical protein
MTMIYNKDINKSSQWGSTVAAAAAVQKKKKRKEERIRGG